MTNKEFYIDKLLAVALENACRKLRKAVYGESCAEKECKDCEFYTVENVENWLNAEHEEPEPPLLENGDGLEPGDWIMVRQNFGEEWLRVKFAFFNNYFFYAISENASFDRDTMCLSRWPQARLREEGE